MKAITTETYEIVARHRTKLQDGRYGWTGVCRAAYSMDFTVVGFGKNFVQVPDAYKVGQVGSQSERDYAKHITSTEISRQP